MSTVHFRGSGNILAFFLMVFSLSALANNSELFLCTLDGDGSNNKIYAITDLDKISTWPWTFDFEENSDLMTQLSENDLSQLVSLFPNRNLANINACWSINATTLTKHYPQFQSLVANSMHQREHNSTSSVSLLELPYQAKNAGSRLALRRGYIIGIISLIIFNNFYPQYVSIGWASLIACFLFPGYADSLFDKIVSIGGSMTETEQTHSRGSGSRLGSHSEEGTTNVGYSSVTVSGGNMPEDTTTIKQTGNVHHF